jgi:hypothetical protein
MLKPRYDEEENVSRHAAADSDCCKEMEDKYGWDLKRIEPIENDRIFKVDCVFEGKTEFPDWIKEQERKEDEDA